MSELVSIITPMYNSKKFIESAINSVSIQTYHNWEMIIIDDGSTDNSVELVKALEKDDKRLRMIVQESNKGSAYARNTGIKNARGRYIAFLDSDDLWVAEKLENQLKFMNEKNCALTFSSYQKINEKGEYLGQVDINTDAIVYNDLLKTNHIGCLTAIFDTKLFGSKMYMPLIKKRHDHGLWLSILKQGHKAYGLEEVLGKYRIRDGSISNNKIDNIKYQWKLYRRIEKLDIIKSLYYMAFYTYNAIRKHSIFN